MVRIGEFRCPPDHAAWTEENYIGPHALFVFPRVPVRIQQADAREVVADVNSVMYYNPDTYYHRGALHPRGDECEWFAIEPDVLRDALAEADPAAADRPRHPFTAPRGPSDAETYLLQRRLTDHVRQNPAAEALAVEEMALTVLRRLVRLSQADNERGDAPVRGTTQAAHWGAVERARQILSLRFREKLRLGDIAAAVHVSPYHLCRMFRRQSGVSLHRFVDHLRLRASLEMLGEFGGDLTQLALWLGYSSHAHFTTAFRRVFGISPSQARSVRSGSLLSELRTILKA